VHPSRRKSCWILRGANFIWDLLDVSLSLSLSLSLVGQKNHNATSQMCMQCLNLAGAEQAPLRLVWHIVHSSLQVNKLDPETGMNETI
jgi:hypothetical protein